MSDDGNWLNVSRLHPAMKRLFDQAMLAHAQGDGPQFAELTLQAVRAAPSPWAYGRYMLFCQYGATHYTDKDVLLSFVRSSEEAAVFRAFAAYTLAAFHERRNVQQMMNRVRQVVEITKQADPQDLDRPLSTTSGLITTVGGELKNLYTRAKTNLRDYYGESPSPPDWLSSWSPGTSLDAGSTECHCCGKTLEELGVVSLHSCGRCKKAFYCSKDCQRQAWKAGHKSACGKTK